MADIRGLTADQTVIRAELDKLKLVAWDELQNHSEQWVDRLNTMIVAFSEHDESPWNIVGILANIGFLHMLESWESMDE